MQAPEMQPWGLFCLCNGYEGGHAEEVPDPPGFPVYCSMGLERVPRIGIW